MTPEALVATLRERGVTLRPDGGQLVVSPASAIRPEEVEALRQFKPEIITMLLSPETPAAVPSTWPASLPGLGRHRVISFSPCRDCTVDPPADEVLNLGTFVVAVPGPRGTFVAFGGVPLCWRHARARGSA